MLPFLLFHYNVSLTVIGSNIGLIMEISMMKLAEYYNKDELSGGELHCSCFAWDRQFFSPPLSVFVCLFFNLVPSSLSACACSYGSTTNDPSSLREQIR